MRPAGTGTKSSFWTKLLERRKIVLKPEPKYVKILDPEFGRSIEEQHQFVRAIAA